MDSLELHIAGGDLEAERLLRRGTTSVLAWREALADGPVHRSTDALWNVRSSFVQSAYGAAAGRYDQLVVDVFQKITSPSWQRIHLHFDTDLFCCVNLMFLVTHLRQVPELIWVTRREASPLTLLDRVFLHSCWHAYASDDPRILEGLIEQAPHSLQAFLPAMQAHLERFPSTITGMGRPQEIIDELREQGIDEDTALISAFIAVDNNRYGWGDLQIRREIDLYRYLQAGDSVQQHLGGCRIDVRSSAWRWDASSRTIRETV